MQKFRTAMKRLFTCYGDLLGVLFKDAPIMVILTFLSAVVAGLLNILTIYAGSHVFNDGLAVAAGEMTMAQYTPYLVMFVAAMLLPSLISNVFLYGYVQPRSMLILRSSYRGRMLQKFKRMRYEHLESDASMEIIDKAYHAAENSARHMFPMYVNWTITSIVSAIGILYYFARVKWWMLLVILIPFAIQVYLNMRDKYSIYDELQKYWKKERQYFQLGKMLLSRDISKEMHLFNSAEYLIGTYETRLNTRNKEYEQYYFKHLTRRLFHGNFGKVTTIGLAVVLLLLFLRGDMSVGIFIALTLQVFHGLFDALGGSFIFFTASPYHLQFFEYYMKYFNLSEEAPGTQTQLPDTFDIEFRDVWFRYPGTERDILQGLSFQVAHGQRCSVVGENGEGKSTMIKLLLGLFTPDKGHILVGGKDLAEYPLELRTQIFGPVFQDFVRYSISLKENISAGDARYMQDEQRILQAAHKGKVDAFGEGLQNGYDTLLGRDFEDGVDLSGGQWQRVAIARAFMGDKPVLLLDEPTSQLDPMAESQLYGEFAEMAARKTAILITHRLGSTQITEKIFVMSGGRIQEEGSHEALMQADGIYAAMFNAQKQWYQHKNGEEAMYA